MAQKYFRGRLFESWARVKRRLSYPIQIIQRSEQAKHTDLQYQKLQLQILFLTAKWKAHSSSTELVLGPLGRECSKVWLTINSDANRRHTDNNVRKIALRSAFKHISRSRLHALASLRSVYFEFLRTLFHKCFRSLIVDDFKVLIILTGVVITSNL